MTGISCSSNNVSYSPATLTPLPVTEFSVTPSITPTVGLLPTISFNTSIPITPYPTASAVKANAVAFIDSQGLDYSLWFANVDGSGERKLADLAENASWTSIFLLQWSPDGSWISYISGDDLWITSPDGSIQRKVLSIQNTNQKIIRKYEWSPDGARIAYALAADWREQTFITVGLLALKTGEISEIDSYRSPTTVTLSWASDGHLLLGKDPSFLLLDISTRKFTKVKELPQESECTAWLYDQLFWSPNRQWFALSWHGNGPYYNRWLCVHDLTGNNYYGITYFDVNGIYAIPPAWDKTGNYLYLVVRNYDDPAHPEINPDLRLIRFNVKTRQVKRLLSLAETEPYALFWNISISPDGEMLEIDARMSDKHQIHILNLASHSEVKFDIPEIPDTHNFHSGNFWSEDNRSVIFFSESNRHFYKLDLQTGQSTVISGQHEVEYWEISPVATTP
jgi:Tol biopolymer transport system component